MAVFEHKDSYVATAMKYHLKKMGCIEGISSMLSFHSFQRTGSYK